MLAPLPLSSPDGVPRVDTMRPAFSSNHCVKAPFPVSCCSRGMELQRNSLGQRVSHRAQEPHGPFPCDVWEFGVLERSLNEPCCLLVHCQ